MFISVSPEIRNKITSFSVLAALFQIFFKFFVWGYCELFQIFYENTMLGALSELDFVFVIKIE